MKIVFLKVSSLSTATKQQMAELKELRDALVANFREQMVLRHRLMEIGKSNLIFKYGLLKRNKNFFQTHEFNIIIKKDYVAKVHYYSLLEV